MLIILKNESEASTLADLLSVSPDSPLKGAMLSSPTYVTDEQGKYAKIEFTNAPEVKNE